MMRRHMVEKYFYRILKRCEMKKIVPVIFASLILFACSKQSGPAQQPPVDYSQYKVKTAVRSSRNYSVAPAVFSSDTTSYTYDGTTCKYVQRRNGIVYEYTATLNNGLYTLEIYSNGTLSAQKTYYLLNNAGYIDSNWISYNGTVNQSSKNHYNADGTIATAINYYSGYITQVRYHYKNGVADFAHSERISQSPSITNTNDSVVYEYGADIPYRADFYSTGLPSSLMGKPSKSLVQRAIYYDKLNSHSIRQTIEYQYQTDAIGLVTRRIFNIYTQPGNNLLLTDTTAYTYYNR